MRYIIFILLTVSFLTNVSYAEIGKMNIEKESIKLEKNNDWKLVSGEQGGSLTMDSLFSGESKIIFKVPLSYKNSCIGKISSVSSLHKVAFWLRPFPYIKYNTKESYFICSIDINGLNFKVLTTIELIDSRGISWSYDNAKIAFVANFNDREEKVAYPPNNILKRTANNSLAILDLDTNEIKILIKDKVEDITSQAWSLDSKKIVYQTIYNEIMIYNLESGTSTLLTKGEYPSWSPTGEWICYAPSGKGKYYIISPVGKEKKRVLPRLDIANFFGFVTGSLPWSPDGRFILYNVGPADSAGQNYVMEVETGRIVRVKRKHHKIHDRFPI